MIPDIIHLDTNRRPLTADWGQSMRRMRLQRAALIEVGSVTVLFFVFPGYPFNVG